MTSYNGEAYSTPAVSFFDWFKTVGESRTGTHGDTDSVRRIASELDRLEPPRARYLAAFAYVLSRVARADLRVGDVETKRMTEILQRIGHLPEDQAALVVEIAKAQSRLFGGTEDFLVTREFRAISTVEERRELVDCLFATAASEDGISIAEESQIRQIASELGFSPDEYVAIRLGWSEHRKVLRGLRREQGS
jgi:uncharacterized tellurite resistance protein B-like protein